MVSDISGWEIDEILTVSGTREKFWIFKPGTEPKERYLFKLPREGTGELWAEKISSEVGKILGLEMVDVSFATYDNREGLLLKTFIRNGNEELFDGGDLLGSILEDFDPYNLNGYTLDNIMTCLNEFDLVGKMVSVIMFDALIANQDRHCENWGVIQNRSSIRFAPIFDNGSSLGYSNSDERLQCMLNDHIMFESFTNRGKSSIGLANKKKIKFKLLLSKLNTQYPLLVQREIDRISCLRLVDIQHILELIPFNLISEIQNEWIKKLLMYRKEWIVTCVKEG